MSCIPLPDADVLTVAMPGEEIVLLHLQTGRYFSLNQTGSLIWSRMEASICDADIVRELVDRFDVTPEAASTALREFLQDLIRQRLLTISEEEPA
jgi:hypothetical protein